MILLIIFAFIAGIVTILSPCILPILPIILSSTIGGNKIGKKRPIGVVIGFIASFTFFTLFLSTIVNISGISANALRFFSIIVIAVFGASLLTPRFQITLEHIFSGISRFAPKNNRGTGFGSGFIIGLSLGLLWTPCVGPILASVISLAITGTVTLNAFLITLAYSIGTAIPMFAVMAGGQSLLKKVPWVLNNSANIQKVFGIIMILTAIGIFFNLDRQFQTFILNKFPQYGTGLTQIEDNSLIRKQLDSSTNSDIKQEYMGKPTYDLQPKGIEAPEIIPGGVWFNTEPLTLNQLKGSVIILDFWTYSCINCQRTLPYLKSWYQKYKDKGLVIIGVHSPEFEFEKDAENVREAIIDFELLYPIVQDNNFSTWQAYNNHYWPAKYFVDKEGYIRYTHFGEGDYDQSEKVIQKLLRETNAKDIPDTTNNPSYQVYSETPETYLGFGRLNSLASNEQIQENKTAMYSFPQILPDNQFALSGAWTVMEEYANPQKGSELLLNFDSKQVFLVMRNKGKDAKVKVYIDNKMQDFGIDNKNGIVTIDSDRLYKLIELPSPGRHILKLEFEDSNAELYAFTFG